MSDEEQARRDNQLFVRAQHKALGLKPPKQDRREREEPGIAHVTLKLEGKTICDHDREPRSSCSLGCGPESISTADIEIAADAAAKQLRVDITGRGGFVNQIDRAKMLNGDIEIRALFVVKGREH